MGAAVSLYQAQPCSGSSMDLHPPGYTLLSSKASVASQLYPLCLGSKSPVRGTGSQIDAGSNPGSPTNGMCGF